MSDESPCVKTPKGIEEVERRTWRLPMRTRQVLIMIDGKRDRAMLSAMFPGDALPGILQTLLDEGFVRPLQPAAPAAGAQAAPGKAKPVAAPADTGERFRMAQNFMANTVRAFIGVAGSSLIDRIDACEDLASLRQHFQAWREAIQLSGDGRKELATLENKLAALLS